MPRRLLGASPGGICRLWKSHRLEPTPFLLSVKFAGGERRVGALTRFRVLALICALDNIGASRGSFPLGAFSLEAT
jgi:hypothetical protein